MQLEYIHNLIMKLNHKLTTLTPNKTEINVFPQSSVSPEFSSFEDGFYGFDAYSSTDFPGSHYHGFFTKYGSRGVQFAINWNNNSGDVPDVAVRVKDDTDSTWSNWSSLAFSDLRNLNSPFLSIDPTFQYNGDGTFTGDLTVNGTITESSDERIKENISRIENPLEKIKGINGVEYNKIGSDKKEIGFIAQEVQKVLPEVVETDESGNLSVAYQRMTAVLLEAIKEQQKTIDELKRRVSSLEVETGVSRPLF